MAGHETSLHYHKNKDAFVVVEHGLLELERDGVKRNMKQGDWALVERGIVHRLSSRSGAIVIELEWPPSREDLIRISDRYGRCALPTT